MANPADITLHASGAETVTGNGAAVDMGATRSCLKLALIVTAVAGTLPTLALTVETGPSETGPWRTGGTFSTVSAVGKVEKTIAGLDQWVRLAWVITGSAGQSFTFSLAGQSHTLYAAPSDLSSTAINAAAIAGIDAEVLAQCCLRASGDFETALNSSYELPITAWGDDARGHCAARAVFYAMSHRGRKPDTGTDSLIDQLGGFALLTGSIGAKSAAQMFFDAVAKGVLKPVGIIDQTPDDFEGSGFVISGEARQW
jgi:hypothetical protein